MAPFAQDGKRLSLLFDYGVVSEGEVIAWADAKIMEMKSPPDALLDLAATRPTDTASIISHLHDLCHDAELWPAFRAALASLYHYVAANPREAERIATAICRTLLTFPDLPEEFSFVNRFDDAFLLARDGTYGDEATVQKEFIQELQRFSAAANQS
jgi:hypothetical protein